MSLSVTVEQVKEAGHPAPERGARRRFISEAERATWLAGLRASEAARVAKSIAERHGEEL